MAKCESCQTNPAQVRVHVSMNGHAQDMQLCTECYGRLQNGIHSPFSSSGFSGFPFDEFLRGLASQQKQNSKPSAGIMTQTQENQGGGFLDQFGRNLSALALNGRIDPVIGRDKELGRVIEILNRRNKNNPVLIGEPGVGKTAIAEGLALKIVEQQVPAKLLRKQVYSLDVASLVADTGIRGQFEERMKGLIAELESRTDVILFIDEIHLLVGAGSAQGSMDAGNVLKPALARGDLQVVGATTLKEYRTIEKDAALERRFQPVFVGEPTVEEAVQILDGIRAKYEQYHGVTFSDEAVRACAVLSHRYIQDRFLPDKAIDLMDEAGSQANLRHSSTGTGAITARLERVVFEKQHATAAEKYEEAAKLRDEENSLREQLRSESASAQIEVTVEDIQRIVEQKTGIPVVKLQQAEQTKLRDLEERLTAKVIGQSNAVQKVAKAIRRSRAGLKANDRPIGAFLFVGPTGVGKTELAKCLAEELFGNRDSLIRLDMSEYMEKHSVSKIIGSPPGYVGHEEAGQLTERVRRHPYSLILLDEIEKAHPDVQHIFLQMMEDGRLTDSHGRTVSFKDTIIIMTSNAGVVDRRVTVGFGRDGDSAPTPSVFESLKGYFRPEFLNRFDGIVEFAALGEAELIQIVDLMLADLARQLEEQNIALHITDAAKATLARMGHHPAFGARPLRRTIQEHVEDKIADVLLDAPAAQLHIDAVDNEIVVSQMQ